jgi:hypothetical protein
MYTHQQLAAMRAHPDRQRILTAILDAHDALPNPTATSTEVMDRARSGMLEVLFDDAMPPGGGLAPGDNPVILGGSGIVGNPHATPEQIYGLMLAAVHEGVHHLDVTAGRSLPGAAATVEQRFFTELHAYTAEYELASENGLIHLLGSEFRTARHLDDIAAGVLTVESYLVPSLARQPGLEQAVVQQVGAMFPSVPRMIP